MAWMGERGVAFTIPRLSLLPTAIDNAWIAVSRATSSIGQSTSFTPRGLGVRVPCRPLYTGCTRAHEQVFLAPGQLLDRRLPLQGRRFGPSPLGMRQLHGKPAAGVFRRLAGSVSHQPLGEIVRDARVERAVATAQHIHEPTFVNTGRHDGVIMASRRPPWKAHPFGLAAAPDGRATVARRCDRPRLGATSACPAAAQARRGHGWPCGRVFRNSRCALLG